MKEKLQAIREKAIEKIKSCDNLDKLNEIRVVYRGSYNASPYGGVSMSNAYNDSSYTYTSIGSRLAFRGKIVMAGSVEAFKSLSEIA